MEKCLFWIFEENKRLPTKECMKLNGNIYPLSLSVYFIYTIFKKKSFLEEVNDCIIIEVPFYQC